MIWVAVGILVLQLAAVGVAAWLLRRAHKRLRGAVGQIKMLEGASKINHTDLVKLANDFASLTKRVEAFDGRLTVLEKSGFAERRERHTIMLDNMRKLNPAGVVPRAG
ncbi:MAG TPA: hypothetical protein PLZ60_02635 [Kiritimatiellia bacterium]|nr:hypothetical protein [Kiritimatiellia bacterium]